MGIPVLGELPLVTSVSTGGDRGIPVVIGSVGDLSGDSRPSHDVRGVMANIAKNVWGNFEAVKS